MIGFLIRGRVRIKLRLGLGLPVTLAFIIGTIVTGANVVHSPVCSAQDTGYLGLGSMENALGQHAKCMLHDAYFLPNSNLDSQRESPVPTCPPPPPPTVDPKKLSHYWK